MEIYDQSKVNWLELPNHIASIIASKLIHIKDYIRFGAVCHSWRTLYIENRLRLPRQPSTLLMLAKYHPHEKQARTLYNITDKRALNFQARVHHKLICGSSHGWLVTAVPRKFDFTLCLVNPLLQVNYEIQLPPLETGIVNKVVLSANPVFNSSYVAFAIHDFGHLAYFKPGDNAWTSLPSLSLFNGTFLADVVYYIDQFYVVDYAGKVFACDLNGPHPKVSIGTEETNQWFDYRRHLVELSGNLLQVCALAELVDGDDGDDDDVEYPKLPKRLIPIVGFFCFKLDSVGLNWIETDNLCGHALFLGDNHALSVLSSDFPECKPNAIYYIDDYGHGSQIDRDGFGDSNVAVFDLTDRTIEPILSEVMALPPIWIEPILYVHVWLNSLLGKVHDYFIFSFLVC